MRHLNYEHDDDFAEAYRLKRDKYAVAWRILGWEMSPIHVWQCGNCDRAGFEREHGGGGIYDEGDPACSHEECGYCDEPDWEQTGKVVAVMVGDDVKHVYDYEDFEPLDRAAYCGECGQLGCTHDGLERGK